MFEYDVFLSFSNEDYEIANKLAQELIKKAGITVFLSREPLSNMMEIIAERQKKIEKSRMLIVCMSKSFFISEWKRIEAQTVLFRETQNDRKFIPILIGECEIPPIISHFKYVDIINPSPQKYAEIISICAPATIHNNFERIKNNQSVPLIISAHTNVITKIILDPKGKRLITASHDNTIKIWSIPEYKLVKSFNNFAAVFDIVFASGSGTLFSASSNIKEWDINSGDVINIVKFDGWIAEEVHLSSDENYIIAGNYEARFDIYLRENRQLIKTITSTLAILRPGNKIVSEQSNKNEFWDFVSGDTINNLSQTLNVLPQMILSIGDRTLLLEITYTTIRILNLKSLKYIATFEGHTNTITCLAVSKKREVFFSGSSDGTVRQWNIETGECLNIFHDTNRSAITAIAVTDDERQLISSNNKGVLNVWNLNGDSFSANVEERMQYTNAKVVLVGDSGVGKTGLALRLAENIWRKTESTHGMRVWPLNFIGMDNYGEENIEKEIWLWDFAGQADYRLIHQLFIDETALALMIIDPQRDNPFEPLEHWEKAVAKAVKLRPEKLLVAARCERGGPTLSTKKIDQYICTHNYKGFLTTSAKTGSGMGKLKDLIRENIPWDRMEWTSTTKLFRKLKDAIIKLKDNGIVIIRVVEMKQRMQMEFPDEPIDTYTVRAVATLLARQGLIQNLDFGDFVLLQPEQINNYASAVVRSARENIDEIGCIKEEDLLNANVDFKDMVRIAEEEEKVLLRAIYQTFINRSLCAQILTDKEGTVLVFPAYFKQDRPEIPTKPNIEVTYRFSGLIDEIYTTLIVRLHYTNIFQIVNLWHYAVDFNATDSKLVGNRRILGAPKLAGFMMTKNESQASAQIKVYFDNDIIDDTKIYFIKYIHEHLTKYGSEVIRERSYLCPNCGNPIKDKKAILKRLQSGKNTITCQDCDEAIILNDIIEEKFGSREVLRMVREMDAKAQIKLDNQSLELILAGHAMSITGEAGQIFRPTPNSDWGIDGEIEFKNGKGEACGERLYLQLKSGDSYLYERIGDGKLIFTIKNDRHIEYWQSHKYPVMLVIRTSDGQIRWMNISEYLKNKKIELESEGKKDIPNQIVFNGEAFNSINIIKFKNKIISYKNK